jgi:hypothetical protein
MERVFSWIDPELFRSAFMAWAAIAGAGSGGGTMAIDGKVMRGTKDAGRRMLNVVNAVCTETGLVLCREFTDEKSNEMKAIPLLLDVLDVKGHIVTIDAGGTYKDIAGKIAGKKGDYVLALKGNIRLRLIPPFASAHFAVLFYTAAEAA